MRGFVSRGLAGLQWRHRRRSSRYKRYVEIFEFSFSAKKTRLPRRVARPPFDPAIHQPFLFSFQGIRRRELCFCRLRNSKRYREALHEIFHYNFLVSVIIIILLWSFLLFSFLLQGALFTMEQQIQNFQKTVDELKTLMGERASELIEKSLILVCMGSNDYINNYLLPLSDKRKTYSPAEYSQLLMHHYSRQLMVKREKKNNKYLSYFFSCMELSSSLYLRGFVSQGLAMLPVHSSLQTSPQVEFQG